MSYHDLMNNSMETSTSGEEEDSPWLEDDNTTSSNNLLPSNQISEQEWLKLSSRYSDAGYREGITSGKQTHLQQGFDQGFSLSAPFAREVGSLRGISASLLSLLTTTAGAKHLKAYLARLESIGGGGGGGKENLILECREIVNSLGKLQESDVVPVDLEAEQHVKEHEEEGMSLEMIERREMKKMEEKMMNLGGNNQVKTVRLEECKARLEKVLSVLGMEGMIGRY